MHAKREPYIICLKWVSIPAAVSKTDKTWTFKWWLVLIWFGLQGLELTLPCTYCCHSNTAKRLCFLVSDKSSPNSRSVKIITSPNGFCIWHWVVFGSPLSLSEEHKLQKRILLTTCSDLKAVFVSKPLKIIVTFALVHQELKKRNSLSDIRRLKSLKSLICIFFIFVMWHA